MKGLLVVLVALVLLALRGPSYAASTGTPTGPTSMCAAPSEVRIPGSVETHLLLSDAPRTASRFASKSVAAAHKSVDTPRQGIRAIEHGAPSPSCTCPHTQEHLQANGAADANGERC